MLGGMKDTSLEAPGLEGRATAGGQLVVLPILKAKMLSFAICKVGSRPMECFLNTLPDLTSQDAVHRNKGEKSWEREGTKEGTMGKEGSQASCLCRCLVCFRVGLGGGEA
jgi:hypothetical protein